MVTTFGQVTAGGQKPQPVHLWSPRHTRAQYSTLAQKSRFREGTILCPGVPWHSIVPSIVPSRKNRVSAPFSWMVMCSKWPGHGLREQFGIRGAARQVLTYCCMADWSDGASGPGAG